ncbi:ribose-phosphate pyrophosphokinase [Ichthyobacterium seriolicida]|uniref:ribose-phosphate diphosphokinase n=1 Tax=Ichthyobacterium seriolicida TaxID=242600 RepID=A0A1J1DYL1_9FLAO|nr:ribose-phosphate pyrophosphokinase [Ichthyobacterium seriolicida]BAV95002.1 ribose-phosphate pyrophosphokinase [Ichthyobacterium seriolicida]
MDVSIFSCSVSQTLATEIANEYGSDLEKVTFTKFEDGEFSLSYDETIRGKRVFIICSTIPPADNLMELLLMIDSAKRASARKINVVIPYFGWARQDRKDKPRSPIGAKLVANLISKAGADRIITMDLHADQIQGFFEIPVDHIFSFAIFLPYLKSLNLDNLAMASPDMGGAKRAYAYADTMNCDVIVSYKQREKANVVKNISMIGDVENKNIIIVDDMVDTAGTLSKVADKMLEKGAKSVRAIATHPILSSNAYENLESSCIEELIVTDSIPLRMESPKIKVISCANIFSTVMKGVHMQSSINKILFHNTYQ